MKKFLSLIVLSFLWCNVGFAECIEGNCINGYGTYTFADGAKYDGEWENGTRHGHGTYTSAKGKIYDGEWENNIPHGYGTLTTPNGSKYVGEFENGTRHGHGTARYKSGNKYVGEFENGTRHGYGTYTFADGAKYDGEWENGKKNGIGTFIYPDGTKRVHEWENDKIVKYFSDEEITEYEKKKEEQEKIKEAEALRLFVEEQKRINEEERIASGGLPKCNLVINETNNLKFSPNKCFLTEQTKFDENFSYEGEIKNSKKHGKGKLILIDPDPELNFTFEGNFKNDILINGSLRTKSIYYEGEFGRNLLFHGNGQMHHLNSGEIYVGKFKDGFPHGNGKWIYSDGDEYVGVFNKGKFSDPGRNEFLEKKAIEEQNSVDNSVDTMIQDVFDERRKKKQAELLTICIDYYEMCKLIVTNGVTGSGRLGPQGICKKCGFVD